MAGIVAAGLLAPAWPESVRLPLRVVGIVFVAAGVALVVWARSALGRSFSTFPRPRSDGERVEAGPYRVARHPMYGGGILVFAGFSLSFGVTALALTVVLAALWWAKSEAEERLLVARYPEYEAYRTRTPRRFWPGVF